MGKGKAKGFRPPRADDASTGMLYGSAAHLTGDTIASPVQLRQEGRALPKGHLNFEDEFSRINGKGKGGKGADSATGSNSTPVLPKAKDGLMPPSSKAKAPAAASGPAKEETSAAGASKMVPPTAKQPAPKAPAAGAAGPAKEEAKPAAAAAAAPARPRPTTPTAPSSMGPPQAGLSEIERRRAAMTEIERRRTEMLERERAAGDAAGDRGEDLKAESSKEDPANADAVKEEDAERDAGAAEEEAEDEEEEEEEDEVQRAIARRRRLAEEEGGEVEDDEDDEDAAAKRRRTDGGEGESQTGAMKQGLQGWAERVNAIAEEDGADDDLGQRCRDFVRKRILKAHAEGNLHSVDWLEEPVPTASELRAMDD